MKKSILVTGVAGSGKSMVCKELNRRKYKAYDIENIEGMFAMYRKGTKEIFEDYDNADPEKIKNSEWLCDVEMLKELLGRQEEDIVFYCGVASNMDNIIPLFDRVVLLKTNREILHKRLSSREGTGDIGTTEESRQTVLGWKDWWEDIIRDKGAIVVSADGDPEEVAKNIIKAVINKKLGN